MTEQEREELIEKMAKAAWERDGCLIWEKSSARGRKLYLGEARAALAVAEPVIREQCAQECERRATGVGNGKDEYSLACKHIAAAIREGEMADVIEKLKEYAQYAETKSERDTFEVAFQEIARLREENARLREALKPFILETRPENNVYGYEIVFVKPEQLSAARAAIREGGVE